MKKKITIYKTGETFFSNKNEAIKFYNENQFGELKQGKIFYSLFEALFLVEEGKAELIERDRKKDLKGLFEKNKKYLKYYKVFKDLRQKGLIVKEGLKFGADFRVYEKGKKPKSDHAKYLVYVLERKEKLDLNDFSAKARIANTTLKYLLLAILDSEDDVSYYEVSWKNIS